MGFHYARDHDLAGFWGRSANSGIEFTENQPFCPQLSSQSGPDFTDEKGSVLRVWQMRNTILVQ
jgi:hypothetical protein